MSKSHLWLEEFLSEDPTVDVDRRLAELDEADDLMLRLLQGGVRDRDDGDAIEEPRLRRLAMEVKERLARFRSLSAERRYLGGEKAGIGSELDQTYDDVFHTLLTSRRHHPHRRPM